MTKLIRIVKSSDLKLLNFINSSIKCNTLDRIIPLVTHIGGCIATILTCLILMLNKKTELNVAGYKAGFALATSHIFIHYLKKLINRPRPFSSFLHINTFKTDFKDYSFPSGHTTAAFSICVTLALCFPAISMWVMILAFTIGLSRIYIGVHYPTDVFVGMVIGTAFALMSNSVVERLLINRVFNI